MRVFAVFVFLLLSGAAAQAQPRNPLYGEPTDFYGTWNNVEVQRNLVVRIEIKPDSGRRVRVTVFGLHNGEPCVFGEYRGYFYMSRYPKDREQDNSAILVKIDRDFVQGNVLLRFNGRGEIVSHALMTFADRSPVYNVERFGTAHRHYSDEGYPRPGEGYSRPGEGYSRPPYPYRGYPN
jgi:hypothetical protein